jgi:uncharacterized protein YydD (DUF2326 family)
MRLSHLYCNRPELFTPIRFRQGLNAVVARIDHPKDAKKLGHNLGKTLLTEMIDFALLKGVNKHHTFKRHAEMFEGFVFFIELELPSGGYITIRRSVEEPSKIAFKRHPEQYSDFVDLGETAWDHWRESFNKAVDLLDSILAFEPIKPWKYRKGIGYFLRTQADYQDVFQLAKFGKGRDTDWKPYLARVLGFNDNLLLQKYKADADFSQWKTNQSKIEAETNLKPKDFDKLRASLDAKQAEVNRKVEALDAFDFHEQEIEMTRSLADSVEAEVAENNNYLYNARHDLQQIEKSLGTSIDFDLDGVKRVFEEAQITFPQQLAKDYNDLLDFNRRILSERQAMLSERAEELRREIADLEKQNAALAKRRQDILKVLGGTDSLKKFKNLQRELDEDRAGLELLREKSQQLEALIAAQKKLRETKDRVETLTASIEEAIRRSNQRYKNIQQTFTRIISTVLHRTALIFVATNENGNMEFRAEFSDSNDLQTDEDRGTTFRKMLCIAFDLSVLVSYANERFFHFVYHDGALENLQEKLKLALLKVIRETCAEHGIQYIFSCLSEDLPTIDEGKELCPADDEIVLKLHDGGEAGRLFKMKSF